MLAIHCPMPIFVRALQTTMHSWGYQRSRMVLYQALACPRLIKNLSTRISTAPCGIVLSTNNYVRSFGNDTLTASVCDAGCTASVVKLNDAVATNYGTAAGLVFVQPYFLAMICQLWSVRNQPCFTDPVTGKICNCGACVIELSSALST
ncbi:hypothetical protein BDV11DRAFT_145199 [Aspergillus similis]